MSLMFSCILRPCNTDNDNLCEPYGFALNDKSGAFHTYFSAACEVEIRNSPDLAVAGCGCDTRSARLGNQSRSPSPLQWHDRAR